MVWDGKTICPVCKKSFIDEHGFDNLDTEGKACSKACAIEIEYQVQSRCDDIAHGYWVDLDEVQINAEGDAAYDIDVNPDDITT